LKDVNNYSEASSKIFHWRATIKGPLNSPYSDGYFLLDIKIPNDYPFLAPEIVFVTKIFHPNVHTDGKICLHPSDWTSASSITDRKNLCFLFSSENLVLFSILELLEYPDFDKPGREPIVKMGKENYQKYYLFAKRFTEKYALKEKPL
uniref:UBC core domain-containing protein n=1 Tax=Rodentolepis nana TaxID=102285 RepID=A0A0R3TDB9_RODNA